MKTIKGLNKTAFRKWLKERSPYELVGESGYCTECPIYNFLESFCINIGINVKEVYKDNINIFNRKTNQDETIVTPAWVTNFIGEVDRYGEIWITNSHALAILNLIK